MMKNGRKESEREREREKREYPISINISPQSIFLNNEKLAPSPVAYHFRSTKHNTLE
jgi:hypothetical protein